MKLLFLRHATAEVHSPQGTDASRRLTGEGREEADAVGSGMAALDVVPDVILTSPYDRARETAERVALALGVPERLREEPRLACGCRSQDLAALLAPQAARGSVLLVGHEPDLSSAIGFLIGGGQVRMRKASLARVDCLDFTVAGGELRWLLEVRQLAALSRRETR